MSEFELQDVRPDLEGLESAELHALVERAYQIELLTQHPGWPYFRDYLARLTTGSQSYVLNGNCKSIEEYRERTGYVRGLRAAMDAPSSLLKRVAEMQAEADGSNI